MKYLLDTCILSELIKKNPNKNLIRWLSTVEENQLFISVLTIGEIHKGIEKLPDSKKKTNLHYWVNHDLVERFYNRILDFDIQTAIRWGQIQAYSEVQGKSMPIIDGLIAATAVRYNLTIVTRNVKDMEISGVTLLNPWVNTEGCR